MAFLCISRCAKSQIKKAVPLTGARKKTLLSKSIKQNERSLQTKIVSTEKKSFKEILEEKHLSNSLNGRVSILEINTKIDEFTKILINIHMVLIQI